MLGINAGGKAMAAYDKDAIIKAYEEAGKPPYSTYHAKQKKAADEARNAFPALMTFKKWLVDGGMLEEKGKQHNSEAIAYDADWKDEDYEEFLLSYVPETVKQNLESCYLKWQNQKLKDELAKLKG
ncbi:MAG: hypothetical protein ACYC58_09115 [Pseudomonadaceae bacterium]